MRVWQYLDWKNPVHSFCGGKVKTPIGLLEPAQCLGCGERFSLVELAVPIITVPVGNR